MAKHDPDLPLPSAPRFSTRRLSVFLVAAISLGVGALLYAHASTSPFDTSFKPTTDAAIGLTYNGLVKVKAGSGHPCAGLFVTDSTKDSKRPVCTHGPDEAAAPLVQATAEDLTDLDVSSDAAAATVLPAADQNPWPAIQTKCYGTGTDGDRVQVLYAYFKGQPNRLAQWQSVLVTLSKKIDSTVVNSSYDGPGSVVKRVRFVTDHNCNPVVKAVELPTDAISNWDNGNQALIAQGLTSQHRHYLVFVDSENVNTGICGIGGVDQDSTPGQSNINNGLMFARVDFDCWGSAESHELFHTLGAVQLDAPDTSGGNHCLDGYDVMCRAGDSANTALGVNGKPFHVVCTSSAPIFQMHTLDCNKNDYFNTGKPTGYLATHWNTADSPYLESDGLAKPPPPPPPTSPISAIVATANGHGYYTVEQNGSVLKAGNADWYHDASGQHHDAAGLDSGHPIVGMDTTKTDGAGYWLVDNSGNVFSFGDAKFEGTLAQKGVHVSNIDAVIGYGDSGYLLLSTTGGVYAFGSAQFHGSASANVLPYHRIAAIARTPNGYWIVDNTGNVYGYGDVQFSQSLSQRGVNVANIVGIVANSTTGYWLVGSDGGVYAFGSAGAISKGSLPARGIKVTNIVGADGYPGGGGYWLAGATGGVFAFGNAKFYAQTQ